MKGHGVALALVWGVLAASAPAAGATGPAALDGHLSPDGQVRVADAGGEAEPREAPRGAEARRTVEDLRAEVEVLRKRVEVLEEGLATSLRALHVYGVPSALSFGGEPVPLDRWDVRERLEREFLLSVGNRAQVVLWLKRSARYFPYIEEQLRKAGLPDDLKYVAVIESALLPTAYSHASALGIWQFIPATGRRYGLSVTAWWDDRRNPEASTTAALALLRDLHARFRTWPLALAAYNAGEARVDQALRQQGVPTYYQLALPTETERYVFRAFAAKLILSDPERYGFQISPTELYRPREADVVPVEVRRRTAIADIAKASGSFYREIRELNAEILDEWLPKGHYRIRVPRGRARDFAARFEEIQEVAAPKTPPAAIRPATTCARKLVRGACR